MLQDLFGSSCNVVRNPTGALPPGGLGGCGGQDFDDVATISTVRVSGAASEELAGALPVVFRAHFVGGASSRLSLVVLSVACTGVGEGAGSSSSTSIKAGASSSGSASEEIADGEFDRGPSSSVFGAVVSEEARWRSGSQPTSARSVARTRPLSAMASSVA